MLIGLPGAGKTTFFRERFAATHDHVSKDALRHTREYSRHARRTRAYRRRRPAAA